MVQNGKSNGFATNFPNSRDICFLLFIFFKFDVSALLLSERRLNPPLYPVFRYPSKIEELYLRPEK